MMDEIVKLVEEKATELYEIGVRDYISDHPTANIDEDSRRVAKERVSSQFMFSMSNLRFPENADWKERFDDWYTDEIKKEILEVCKRSLTEEIAKKQTSEDDGLSDIDRYLRKHGMGKGSRP